MYIYNKESVGTVKDFYDSLNKECKFHCELIDKNRFELIIKL